MAKAEKIYEYKKMRVENTIHHLFREQGNVNWKHHNPDGPAIGPVNEGDRSVTTKYYLYGIEKTKDEFNEYNQEKEGLPWYKNPSMKAVARFQIMKIGLCGTVSVGKTTLVNTLKELDTFEGYITLSLIHI